MRSLTLEYLDALSFKKEHIAALRAIGEFKGKQELYYQQSPEVLNNLIGLAAIESTISSNRIEGVSAEPGRVEALVLKTTKPKNRDEREIAGYRDALVIIHESWEAMNFNINVIKQLHTVVFRYTEEAGGEWKTGENQIVERDRLGRITRIVFTPVLAADTPAAMEQLVERHRAAIEAGHDPLVIIPLTILDYLSIHPFREGNGRTARLLTLLLLYHHGYNVGRYISLERIIEESKKSYYETLNASSQQWHEGEHDPFPWLTYWWGVMIRSYKEFEERVGTLKPSQGSKTEQVEIAVKRQIKPFTFSEIESECPGVGKDMIRVVLRQLRDQGRLRAEGTGRGAKWFKIEGRWD
ncbi:MAG: Fic family protein [Thermoplasmata archaeon]|nr:Fic family protein [Thermoplasmata archaeon]